MVIRHGRKLKLDSTHKTHSVFVLTLSGRIRWNPFPGCGTTKHRAVPARIGGKFKTPMEAASKRAGGMDLLRHFHHQPWETHKAIAKGKKNSRDRWAS